MIRAGTSAAEGVPEADMIKRNRVSLFFVTIVDLSIWGRILNAHNIVPELMTDIFVCFYSLV